MHSQNFRDTLGISEATISQIDGVSSEYIRLVDRMQDINASVRKVMDVSSSGLFTTINHLVCVLRTQRTFRLLTIGLEQPICCPQTSILYVNASPFRQGFRKCSSFTVDINIFFGCQECHEDKEDFLGNKDLYCHPGK